MLVPVFNEVAGLCCEYTEIFKNIFFHRKAPVASSEIFINFPGKHQWRRLNRFTELLGKVVF